MKLTAHEYALPVIESCEQPRISVKKEFRIAKEQEQSPSKPIELIEISDDDNADDLEILTEQGVQLNDLETLTAQVVQLTTALSQATRGPEAEDYSSALTQSVSQPGTEVQAPTSLQSTPPPTLQVPSTSSQAPVELAVQGMSMSTLIHPVSLYPEDQYILTNL